MTEFRFMPYNIQRANEHDSDGGKQKEQEK